MSYFPLLIVMAVKLSKIRKRLWWWFSHYVMSDCCNTMDCSLPGSSVNWILQARILEWVAISFSRGSSWPRNQTQVRKRLEHVYSWIFSVHGSFRPQRATWLRNNNNNNNKENQKFNVNWNGKVKMLVKLDK